MMIWEEISGVKIITGVIDRGMKGSEKLLGVRMSKNSGGKK